MPKLTVFKADVVEYCLVHKIAVLQRLCEHRQSPRDCDRVRYTMRYLLTFKLGYLVFRRRRLRRSAR